MRFFLLIALLASGLVQAADPTRPPDAWLNALQEESVKLEEESPRLQSVLLPQRGKPVAIIGGKTVRLGERYGNDTLIRIRETDVVLRGVDGDTRLYLTPEVDKRMIKPKTGQAGKKKDAP
jgi:MSHA biogenesis protein MshK